MKLSTALAPLVGLINRHWLTLLGVWAVLALTLAGAIVWKSHEAKDAAEGMPILRRREEKALKKALVNERGRRQHDSTRFVVLKKNWMRAEQKALIHEQRADSILKTATNEAATATLSAPGGLQRFLATYKPRPYRAGPDSRDTLQ